MGLAQFHRRVISGEAGAWAAPLRLGLSGVSLLYGAGLWWRNRRYDRPGAVQRAEVPVVSVGNLTTGGTGKTPMVIEVVRRLMAQGRRPAVVSRGYRAHDALLNDELKLILLRCPSIACVRNADRVQGAHEAARIHGADVVVLDDGFQHRRLARDLDLVLVDATLPFGYGRLLPRGLLREPCSALQRADAFVITRCDQATPMVLTHVEYALRSAAGNRPILRCRHAVEGWFMLEGAAAAFEPFGRRVFAFAGIGNPDSFRRTLEEQGAIIAGYTVLPDHHRYTPADLDRLLSQARASGAERLVTTEKDAVKIRRLGRADTSAILTLRVMIDFIGDGDRMLDELLDCAAGRRGAAQSASREPPRGTA